MKNGRQHPRGTGHGQPLRADDMAVGLGCTAIANHKLHKAIDAYNDGLASPATDDLSLHVGVTSDGGVGLTLSF